MEATAAIATRNLSRRFGAVKAVDELNLQIPEAQIYGFLGPNGSGKSTTFRMICGLLKPSEGEVDVLGHHLPRDAERIRGLIGYMTQQFSLYRDLTVLENLQFMGQIQGLSRRERRDRISHSLKAYRLERYQKRRAEHLSGGERQRLALAAALIHRPPLLLLDEPTSAVDPQTRRDFWDTLFELISHGTTILVSTHYMDEAERCHRLAILDRGRLVCEGEPLDLMRNIDATVIEVTGPDLMALRETLAGTRGVWNLTQLGSRLHVLLDPSTENPVALIEAALARSGLQSHVAVAEAGLEDVFVAATGRRPS